MLLHAADAGAALAVGDACHIHAANGNSARLRLVQAQQKLEHRALARTGAAHQRDLPALLYRHGEITQDGLFAIAEGHMCKLHIPARSGPALGRDRALRLSEKGINALDTRYGRLDGLDLHAKAIDFEQAQEASDGLGVAVYRTQSGELVMAACYLVPYAAEDVAAMRLVTSLTLVGAQIKNAIAVSVVIAAVILAFTVMSGLYFIRSIVVPLGQVERTAASIARGELDVRLPVTGNEHDEVDRLRGTINQMAEGLEETEKMKNEFISSVSHELRTPLTSIRGWVETLRTLDDPADENYRKGLEIINNETGRLYNMVEELLDFSRLQNGRIRMDCRPLDLVAELTDAVLFCEARIQREGLVLSYTEPEEMIPVYADPDRLRQVFINIMDNAIKYSAPGGRITVKLWAGEYKAFAEIIDQGRGIPPEDLENVKTKFYKGSNSVRGSGIGLALVDSIMTALDGTMDIKSTLGRGTVVTLGLPLYHKA